MYDTRSVYHIDTLNISNTVSFSPKNDRHKYSLSLHLNYIYFSSNTYTT